MWQVKRYHRTGTRPSGNTGSSRSLMFYMRMSMQVYTALRIYTLPWHYYLRLTTPPSGFTRVPYYVLSQTLRYLCAKFYQDRFTVWIAIRTKTHHVSD